MKQFTLAIFFPLLFQSVIASSQQITFNLVTKNETNKWGFIQDIAQDQQGYIWFATQAGGLCKYDGKRFINYRNHAGDLNSLAYNWASCLVIDSSNIIWIGTFGFGLDRFDPLTNTFTHFRHDVKNNSSLSSDTVFSLLKDHLGNIWVGTHNGLNMLDKKTGKFTRYFNRPGDAETISNNLIRVLYEDRNGTLWIGCGSAFPGDGGTPKDGGLNRFNRNTGKFTQYLHDPADPNSIANNKVTALFEDRKGIFWVGTAGDGLHTMDRATGRFTHYYYDPAHPEKLNRPPVDSGWSTTQDHITILAEDASGALWIGSLLCGINRYDPVTKDLTHYGYVTRGSNRTVVRVDSAAGFKDDFPWDVFASKDGLLWIATLDGNLYNINPLKISVPYFPINTGANSFYFQLDSNMLWIGTNKGLVREDLTNNSERIWAAKPLNNGLSGNVIFAIRSDAEGKLWLATNGGGLCKYDPETNIFTTWRHMDNGNSLSDNSLNCLYLDHEKNVWIGTQNAGLDKMSIQTGMFHNYAHNDKDSNALCHNAVNCIVEDKNNELWIGTDGGLDRLSRSKESIPSKQARFTHYLPSSQVKSVCIDAAGVVWAGTAESLYYFDRIGNRFLPFTDPNSKEEISSVLHVMEDDERNLWVATPSAIVNINTARKRVKRYGESYGVHRNSFTFVDNFTGKNGQLFFGDQNGYYTFFPRQLKDNNASAQLNFTSFKLADKEVKPSTSSVLNVPVWQAHEIKLSYRQNVFSFDFAVIHYNDPGEENYLFMLENYNNTWHQIGADHTAYFFNVPPGNYIFHAKAVIGDGTWVEKTISIIITPPWWETWWFRVLSVIALVIVIYAIVYERSRKLKAENVRLEQLVSERTAALKKSLAELKATQTQLIHQEKMASLGELTAGIAHEIQNPLNFVNNFSDVNQELLAELKDEADKGNIDEVKAIADDVIGNEEKINHHGKRADAIVKGMLQHSKSGTGIKEPTDINKLADEYLRLSYHGMRAKDKSFEVKIKTDFDESIGKVNIVSQDIGRVLINLFNNAFYALNEKKKTADESYQPTVSVETKKINGKIEIKVEDNGNGIPQNIVDKIFQPFFTTKPTGLGTGLGLSLAYDIIKAHGGEIKVNSQEGEGSAFRIQLPV